jgi:hypothetical protein
MENRRPLNFKSALKKLQELEKNKGRGSYKYVELKIMSVGDRVDLNF